MKTKLLLLLILLISTISFAQQYTVIPDANFENALGAYDDIPNDGQIPTANIQNITSLDVSSQNISDLTGIQDFTALEELDVYDNQLTSLDISHNTALQYLDCEDNQITTLDTSSNQSLTTLNCAVNQLSALDISSNTSLQSLYCFANQLTNLDLTQNTALIALGVGGTLLNSVDISQNVNLIYLLYYAGSNLDISHNTNLTQLQVYYSNITNLNLQQNVNLENIKITNCNNLATLDLSSNVNLQFVNCTNNNNLSTLNIKNGNNTNITYYSSGDFPGYQFYATNNPNLTCIEVDDPAWSTANWTNIDSQTSFSSDCSSNGLTYVPDDNFEQELINLGYDSGALDDYVPTNNINSIVSLNVGQKNIADLTGIEDFTALQYLFCYGNQLTSLDITQNINLKVLSFEQNQISSINISQNTLLEELYISLNLLTNIDISQNQLLKKIYLNYNDISNLNLSNHPALTHLSVSGNNLTNLDVGTNPLLEVLVCSSNYLTNLDISNNLNLVHFDCAVNHISNIDISQHSNIIRFFAFNNDLTYLNVANSNNINFLNFNASYNPDLTCIIVDDSTWSNINWSSSIDPTSTFVNNQSECDALSVTDNYFNNNLKIYPNPAKNSTTIQIDRKSLYKLYSINGQLLKRGELKQGLNTLNLKGISKGIYLIKVSDNQMEINKKLIIK